SDPITEAEASLAEAEALLDEDETAPEDEVAQGEASPELSASVQKLQSELTEAREDIATLASILERQSRVISQLTRRVMALENEDVVTERMGGLRTLAAARGTVAKTNPPKHYTERSD